MVSIGTKIFFSKYGEHKLSSDFTGDPDTGDPRDFGDDPKLVNC